MKKIFGILIIIIMFCSAVFTAENKTISTGEYVSKISVMKKYTDVNHRILMLSKMRNQTKQLSEADINVIKKYVYGAVKGEDTYLLINCYLRGNLQDYVPKKEITTPLKCRLDYYAKALSSSISKTRLPQNTILYRGIDEKGAKALFASKNVDNLINLPVSEDNLSKLRLALLNFEIVEKGFMSTSYDKNCAKQTKFLLEVNAPKNIQAVLIEDLGKKSEKEVIINKQTVWKIVGISIESSKGRQYYRMKLRFVKK